MKIKKIILVVDNPIRDLYGQILLATNLAEKGLKVFLISMNEMYINRGKDVWAINPDYILINYLRKNNQDFIKKIIDTNTKFGVLDTEGGVLTSLESYKKIFISDKEILSRLNTYFSWGKLLGDYLVKENYLSQKQVLVSGTPRFDFYTPPLKNIYNFSNPLLFTNNNPIILINCNFPIANPKFQSKDQEKSFLVNVLNFPHQTVSEMIRFQDEALLEFIETTKKLSNDYPNINFILRPHPFESEEIYLNNLNKLTNIIISKDGPVIDQISISMCVLHRNCSTAIESQLLKVPAISLRWINVFEEQPLPESVSLHANNYKSLKLFIDDFLANKHINSLEISNNLMEIEENWFNKFDGNSNERIANKIIDEVKSNNIKSITQLKKNYKASLKFSLKERLRGLLFLLMGISELGTLKIRKKSNLKLEQKIKLFIIYIFNISKNNKNLINAYYYDSIQKFMNSEKKIEINNVKQIHDNICNLLQKSSSQVLIRYAIEEKDFLFKNPVSNIIVFEQHEV
jgi:surface carbohydrate biosynthesis protein